MVTSPPTVSSNPTTQGAYATQFLISAAVVQAIRELWASVSPFSSEAAMQSFAVGAQAVVGQWSQAAVVAAGDNYSLARRDAGAMERLRLPRYTPAFAPKVAKELAWVESERQRFDREFAELVAESEAQILAEAAVAFEKIAADEARQFSVLAVAGDEKALGFRRVARPNACAFCLMLATRRSTRGGLAIDQVTATGSPKSLRRSDAPLHGDAHWGVYKSRALAGQLPPDADEVNGFHFNCHCMVEPVFSLDFEPPQWLQDTAALYDNSKDFNDFRRRVNAQRGTASRATKTAPAPVPSPQRNVPDVLAALDAAMSAAR